MKVNQFSLLILVLIPSFPYAPFCRLASRVDGTQMATYTYDLADRLTGVNGMAYTYDDNSLRFAMGSTVILTIRPIG
jgi:YD repeat-containing protein